jgi:hypothetical protein
MKSLALALVLALPVPKLTPPAQLSTSTSATAQTEAKKGGRWYFAATGHAVYCYGPVMTVPQAEGGLVKVATFCRGDQTMVPLKD